jgi:hypothetical protein
MEASDFLVETHFIIGLPEQRVEHVLDTIIFLMGKRLLLGPSIFYLAPNSETYDQVFNVNGYTGQQFKLMRSSAMVPVNPYLPRDILYTFLKLVRFVNLVKRLLDGSDAPQKLSDIPEMKSLIKNFRDRTILATVINEKRLVWFDSSCGDFVVEPHSSDLVKLFFYRARNKPIRGFKTMNQLVVK